MSIIHYDETPLPVGIAVSLNGSDESYELGLCDGATYAEQWPDEPEYGVLFENPECARRWLEAATAVLTPYIESGNQDARVPDPTGWAVWDDGAAS